MYGVLVSKLMSNFKSKENALLGQGCVLQSLVSNAEPEQLVPPCWGTGFVQVLVLFCVPVPQGFVHSDHSSVSDHPPSTKSIIGKSCGGKFVSCTRSLIS